MNDLVSVFTPTHDPKYLDEVYACLQAQDYLHWEWIVVFNGDAPLLPKPLDPRVLYIKVEDIKGVGAAKRVAVGLCKGRILVELDHDDILEPTALSEVVRAFDQHPQASLVFSRFSQVTETGEPHHERFDPIFGWDYDEQDGLQVPRSLATTPHNVSLIWYAPNHVRAFTREAYDKTLGYDSTLEVLDDLDLMAKLYRVGEFISIDKMLYRQRIHPANTQKDPQTNSRIQKETWDHYERNVLDNARAWAERNGLSSVSSVQDIGAHGMGQVGVIHLIDQLHLYDHPEMLLKCAHIALAPNGLLLTLTPATDGRGAFVDEAQSYWNEWTFRRVIDDQRLFQISRMRTFYPTTWHEDNKLAYVQANLIAIKDGYTREGGFL